MRSFFAHRSSRLLGLALLLSLGLSPMAMAEEMTADQIIDAAVQKGAAIAFQQGTANIQMVITGSNQQQKSRSLTVRAMKDDNNLLKSMIRFDKPAEVAGISFLVIEKKDALPDQYVYVPAAKVVRRVAAGNASSSFFGSDFAFLDLMPMPMSERDKVEFKRLPDAEVGKQPCYVIEAIPKIEGSPYGKLVTYVQKDSMTPLKIEFFDGKKEPLKTLQVRALKKIKGQHVPVDMKMTNHQQGSNTRLTVSDINPDAKLSPADFTEEAMQR